MSPRKRVALAIGDPAGIGCEIALKALAKPQIQHGVDAVIVGDAWLVAASNERFGVDLPMRIVDSAADLRFDGSALEVLDVPARDKSSFQYGVTSADNGRALLAYARAAIRLAMDGRVDCVIAAPQNETSVHQAGIRFSGYPGFVAQTTGAAEDDVFLMLASERYRITHATLHVSMREAIDMITHGRVLGAIRATQRAVQAMGVPRPRIGVSGLNPHAGEHGLFGREEIEIIGPAVESAKAEGIDATGPVGADVLLAQAGCDAYVVMIHDQGHIPGKLQRGTAGFCIGAPILFASVAHGSAHDIAGQGRADPVNIVNALCWATGLRPPSSDAR